eukprot:SAG11_NODE_2712_length_3053_cov_2.161083_1_plen_112_part_00
MIREFFIGVIREFQLSMLMSRPIPSPFSLSNSLRLAQHLRLALHLRMPDTIGHGSPKPKLAAWICGHRKKGAYTSIGSRSPSYSGVSCSVVAAGPTFKRVANAFNAAGQHL